MSIKNLPTGETIGYIQDTFASESTKKNTDNSLLVANLTHTSEMIDDTQQNQWMNNDILDGIFCWRHSWICMCIIRF